jgi:hypothetical protein
MLRTSSGHVDASSMAITKRNGIFVAPHRLLEKVS